MNTMKSNRINGKLILFVALFLFTSFLVKANDAIQRPVTFSCKDLKITGKLILPQSSTKVPVIVWIEGSGPNSPLDTNRQSWYYKNFTELLLKQNIGILYYNKRGVGGSEGKWHTLDFFDRAEETSAAIDFLMSLPEVDPTKIGVMGHSQGGWIAQLVASRYPEKAKFAISLCGPTYSVRTQIVNDFQSEYFCGGLDSLKANKKAISKTNKVLFAASVLPVSPNLKQLKRIKDYDPSEHLKKIKIPTLLVFCEYDVLVYPSWCIAELNKTFNNSIPKNISLKLIPSASHGFAIKPGLCALIEENSIVYSPVLHEFYIDWILKQLQN